MQSDRWKRIDQLLDAALELEPVKRSSFLEQNCAGDEGLRREVEELLACHEQAQGFIDSPAYHGAAELLSAPAARLSESQLLSGGRYQVLSALGSGGMGEVYRAKDLRLGREVAIKVLPERLAKDAAASKRFESEAKALAVLPHPNIVSIFDIGSDPETSYVVMELLRGETLRARLQKGPLDWPEAVDVAIAIEKGLSAAHSKGVIHRDLKPENVFLTEEGTVKLLDFGLARFDSPLSSEDGTPTQPGLIMGTVGYMSPEQIRAGALDARSDLFSFGCILYEMLAGLRPFAGNGQAETIASILRDEPQPVSQMMSDLPPGLNEIIQRCLAKNPEHRYPSAAAVAADLENVLKGTAFQHKARQSRLLPLLRAAVVVTLLIAAVSVVKSRLPSSGTQSTLQQTAQQSEVRTMAILPFRPMDAQHRDEVLEIGMADTLITRLGGSTGITVRPLASIRNLSPDRDPVLAGKVLQADAVLEGSLQRAGDRIRVDTRLIRVKDGTEIWAATFDERSTDIFQVQDAIATRIAAALGFELKGDDRVRLQKSYTSNPEAYEYYLRGRYHTYQLGEDNLRKGIALYELAVTADPNYALAYAELADAYRRLGIAGFAAAKDVFQQSRSSAKKALELDESLPLAHVALGWIEFLYDWDWRAAEAELKKAIELSPNDSDAHLAYAHFLSSAGRHEQAISEGHLASALSPATLIVLTLESQFLLYAGRHEDAISQAQKVLDIDPDFWVARNQLGRAYCVLERYPQAIAELSRAKKLAPGSLEPMMQLGYTLAKMGDRKGAFEVLEDLKKRPGNRYFSFYCLAMIYNGLGEREKALELLEKAVEEREAQLTHLNVDPRWNNLRDSPRFSGILRKMNLEVPASGK